MNYRERWEKEAERTSVRFNIKENMRLTISLSSLSDSRIMGCFLGLPGPLRFFPWSEKESINQDCILHLTAHGSSHHTFGLSTFSPLSLGVDRGVDTETVRKGKDRGAYCTHMVLLTYHLMCLKYIPQPVGHVRHINTYLALLFQKSRSLKAGQKNENFRYNTTGSGAQLGSSR